MNLKLRTVDVRKLRERQTIAHWQAQGIPVTSERPAVFDRYIAFRASGASGVWHGLVAVDAWLLGTAPALARLAMDRSHEDQLLKLFAATAQPISLPFALACDALQVDQLIDGAVLPDEALPCILTPQGKVWLQTLPEANAVAADAVSIDCQDLPVPLQFELGTSHISVSLLSQLATGDALLISHAAPRISSQGLTIGRYVWTKEGIIMDQLQEDFADELSADTGALRDESADATLDAADGEAFGGSAAQDASNASQRSMAQVPVRLEFTLGKKLMTVGELSRLSPGQLMVMTPDIEKRIAISANGVLLGHGELVRLDDRLAVEINHLYSEKPHA
jgi:type III secretion protein Q